MKPKHLRLFSVTVGLLTVGLAFAAMVTSNTTLRIWRGTFDSGDATRPVSTQPGTAFRLVANVAEPVLTTQPAVNSSYRLHLGVLFARSVTPDCNTNGTPDPVDIQNGTSRDCNTNQTPDECDIAAPGGHDCNTNGTPDVCEPDCNTNATADACEGDLRPCILVEPVDIVICSGNEGPIGVVAGCLGPFTYEWHLVNATGDHLLPNWTGPSIVVGAPGEYYVFVCNPCDAGCHPCGCVESDRARLIAVPRGGGDGNGDGVADGADVQGMVDALLRSGPAHLNDCAYDMNTNRQVDGLDVPIFAAALLQ